MDLTGTHAEIHLRTDAKNLVSTASTTHLPEQKECIHMITMLRKEALSGAIHDLAHVVIGDMFADCLTKAQAKPDNLMKVVNEGILTNCVEHPSFREMMKDRHKACFNLASWCISNVPDIHDVVSFLGMDIRQSIRRCLYCRSHEGA